jgi:outer membrane protein assembly factor BamB
VPVKTAAGGTMPPGTRPQAYAMYYSEKDLLVAGSMVRHYAYAAEKPALTPASEKLPGAASQPIQRHPATGGRVDFLYVARRVPGSSGIAFTALDAKNLETKWEAVLGTGVLAIQPADASKSTWVVLTRSGHVFSVSAANLTAGGVIDKPVGRIEIEGEFSDTAEPLKLADGSYIFTPAGTPNRLFVRGADAQVRPLDLLAPLQRPVALFDDGILVPATDGRIYWISPATGKSLADPFQPPLIADKPSEWRGVGVTAKKTIIAVDSLGNLYQIEPRKDPAHLAERSGTKLPMPIRSGIVVTGNLVGGVDDANVMHVWDAETLKPISEIKLSAPASLGPVEAGGYILVAAGDNELVCVNPEGQEIWRHPLEGQNIVGRPLVKRDAVHFVTSSGLVRALRLTDGETLWSLDTEKSLSAGPIDVDDKLVVIGDDGSLNVVKAPGGSN